MIRKNSLLCKIIRMKKTSIQLFHEYMLSYSWEDETCPWCGSKGNCVSHGSYMRSMADLTYGKTVYGEICVLRLRCTSCGHTHAILPDVIIPYSVYGALVNKNWTLKLYFLTYNLYYFTAAYVSLYCFGVKYPREYAGRSSLKNFIYAAISSSIFSPCR